MQPNNERGLAPKVSGTTRSRNRIKKVSETTFAIVIVLLGESVVTCAALGQSRAHLFNWSDTRTVDNEVCLSCHADNNLKPKTKRGRGLRLLVEKKDFDGSFHRKLACVDCHQDGKTFAEAPHNNGAPMKIACGHCHTRENEAYKKTVHGRLRKKGDNDVATCADCHGRHGILSSTDIRSKTNKFNLYRTCGVCHSPTGVTGKRHVPQARPSDQYVDSIHGMLVQQRGLAVAPTCNDCHGSHDIQRHEMSTSRISPARIPDTCSKCHVFAAKVYRKSVHGRLLAKGDKRAPNCIDCHSSHSITSAVRPEFSAGIDSKCGQCHEDRLVQYRETIHGKEVALGSLDAASCSDCHGNHDILPSKDPGSHTHPSNRLKTCRRCHPKSTENFSEYEVHAHHTDKASSPLIYWVSIVMSMALIVIMGIFVINLIFWAIRAVIRFGPLNERMKSLRAEIAADKVEYIRFTPIDRLLHMLSILSFIGLFITGIPLKFYFADWAKSILSWLGGHDVAALLHRIGAALLLSIVALHLMTLLVRFWRRRAKFNDPESGRFSLSQFFSVLVGPDSIWLRWQDFKDYLIYQKWLFGKGPRPRFDRWTYWEKTNYHVLLCGVFIIAASGLVLWFPETATIILPGWSINMAHAIHSDFTLLATGFIFSFHYFSAHLRVEKFPFDLVIFTGRVSRTELAYERPKLLQRLEKADGAQTEMAERHRRYLRILITWLQIAIFVLLTLMVAFVFWTVLVRILNA